MIGLVGAGNGVRQTVPRRLSVNTARRLLDFRGSGMSPISEHAAGEQLAGAVALHNILQEENVAYLADEVGMGKTYVALGALALFRHFDPSFRVLVITPRENIQKKWLKELRNFTARNFRFPDLRVKGIHGGPARATVLCQSLTELVRETAVDADRDFFARLTSFSLPLGKNAEGWKAKRDHLIEYLPWLEPSLFDLRNKDLFKDNFARAVNCALPTFDLVIVDEGHNVKAGFRAGAASRNRVLALAFGHPTEREARREGFPGYSHRAKRVLFLSATPLENDYAQLWNQLDIFGFGAAATVLRDANASDDDKRQCAGRFLIRRVTTIPVCGKELTKNLYRREWRGGGVSMYDEPLTVPDEKQRLVVALVQKKVSEVLGTAKFNSCFQIGMLASFESFLETARIRPKTAERDDTEGTFDDPEQADDVNERLGIDVGSVNHLARSYRRTFRDELPHPKMDAVVERLTSAFTTGAKGLVFVRRVASVQELQRKLEERYDRYLFGRLRSELKATMRRDLERLIKQYHRERAVALRRRRPALIPDGRDDELVIEEVVPKDRGGVESFFAWFFRGDGPAARILSGATLQRRFSQAGALYSTFFEDNHVAWLLGARPGDVARKLAKYVGMSLATLESELGPRAVFRLPRVKRQQRRNIFLAFQGAAVELLAEHEGELRERARVVLEERYSAGALSTRGATEPPPLGDWLEVTTFWTALRDRPGLRAALWPEPAAANTREVFRETELRRELLSAMARLGHPFIDLYVLSVNRIGRLHLRAREQEEESGGDLAADFLGLLEGQAAMGEGVYTSYHELVQAAQNFDLILAVNEPEVRAQALANAATLFGRLLRAQQPIGGMFGQVNETLVRQFRMPGYPLVLITTDLLQEGEDLHTFCSAVYHYGISWMPSSMEQRVGRIDRVSSQTDRRLTAAGRLPDGAQLLQVYYPHLQGTVEVLQVGRVFERLNRFIRLMHEDLGSYEGEQPRVDVSTEILRLQKDLAQPHDPLKTAFPVRSSMLQAPPTDVAVERTIAVGLLRRFLQIPAHVLGERMHWEDRTADNALFGTIDLQSRQQPFTLLLRSVGGQPVVRCVSPVGVLSMELTATQVRAAVRDTGVRVGAVFNQSLESYNLTIEGDVLLGGSASDAPRVAWLLQRVNAVADRLEEMLLGCDEPMATFRRDLDLEVTYER